MEEHRLATLGTQLKKIGPIGLFPDNPWFDYQTLNLNAKEIPLLLTFIGDKNGIIDYGEVDDYISIHAWRALGQMKATSAIPHLIKCLFVPENLEADVFLRDFPKIMGMMGEAALPYLKPLLLETNTYKDSDDSLWIKSSIITAALSEIVKTSPETRQEAIETIRVYITDILCIRDNFFIACALSGISSIRPIELKDRVFELLEANRIDYEGISEKELAMVLGED